MNYYIYTLNDENDEPRYIGKTVNPKKRMIRHLSPYYLKPITHKNNWIKEMLSNNLKPEMRLIEVYNDEKTWQEAEIHFIAFYKKIGCDLTNATDGGDGAACGSKNPIYGTHRPQSVKDAVGRANKGKTSHRKLTDEQIALVRELLSKGVQQVVIAKQFNVTRQAIWGIAHGKTGVRHGVRVLVNQKEMRRPKRSWR